MKLPKHHKILDDIYFIVMFILAFAVLYLIFETADFNIS